MKVLIDVCLQDQQKFELYRHDKLFVNEPKTYEDGGMECYGILGSSAGKVVCYMCPDFVPAGNCSHVKLIQDEEMQDQHPVIVEFLSQIGVKRSRNKKRFDDALTQFIVPLPIYPSFTPTFLSHFFL